MHVLSDGMNVIRPAVSAEQVTVTQLVRKTIEAVYPKYYPAGAVSFFVNHHEQEKIRFDIEAGKVYVIESEGVIAGTVTVDGNEIARLFVEPSEQGKGHGGKLIDFAENMIFGYSETVRLDSSLPAKSIYIKRGYKEKEYKTICTGNGDFLCYDVMEKNIANDIKKD